MSRIFLIAGLGVDCRIFKNVDLEGHDIIAVNWIIPEATDTLTTYAQKLIKQYGILEGSIVIGNSLGGMLGVEIAKLVPLKQVILISCIKTIDEAPAFFKFFKLVPVYRIIPVSFLRASGPLLKFAFGDMVPADLWLFKDMLKNTPPVFLKWAMHAVLKFNNETVPARLYHISGDNDRLFNYKRLKNATIVKGGSHIMLFDKASEINKILKPILAN